MFSFTFMKPILLWILYSALNFYLYIKPLGKGSWDEGCIAYIDVDEAMKDSTTKKWIYFYIPLFKIVYVYIHMYFKEHPSIIYHIYIT